MTDSTSGYSVVMYKCRRCEGNHPIEQCPQVKRIEFDEAGQVKWVEFFAPGDYLPPIRREKGPFDPPYDITVTSTFTTPYDMNKARAWYEATKTYTY